MTTDDPSESPLPAPAGKLLCVEDDETSLAIVEVMMKRFPQIQLTEATNGADGIRLARAERPDLVLLDMQLPDMSGIEVLQALRSDAATRTLRVVAVSANAMPADMALAQQHGAQAYWTKPLDLVRFRKDVRRLLHDECPAPASSTTGLC